MTKLLLFLFKILIIVGLAIFVADRSGRVSIEWHDSIIETSTAFLIAAILLAVIAGVALVRLAQTARKMPASYRARRLDKRQKQGQYYLGEAVNAMALEKKRRAAALVRRAERLLGPGHLVDMVKNQVTPARMTLAAPTDGADFSSPYAWRAAILRHLEDGEHAKARALAERFAAKHPALPLPRKLLLDVLLRQGAWDEAVRALDSLRGGAVMARKDIRQLKAAIQAERAREALANGDARAAFEWAMQAERLRGGWIPALQQAAVALAALERPREAAALIAQAWPHAAHPQLAQTFLALKTGKNELKTAQEAEKIARRAPEHPASLLLLAQAYLRANLHGQARRHAEELATAAPGKGAYTLLMRIADAERRAVDAQKARAKALDAPPDPAWVCQSCKQPHANWQLQCVSCRSVNLLHWDVLPHL